MSSSPLHSDARRSGQASFVVSLALLMFGVGVTPAVAQQRIEIVTKRVGRTEMSDSVRKLQRSLDSLSQAYNDDDQLSALQRRKLEADITLIVERLDEVSRINGGMLAPSAPIGVRMGPADAERAAQAMSRALMQVREFEQAAPRGWIGFVAQGPGLEPRVESGQLIVRYFSYPGIISVDPSSPAQRAGITTNDTLLAYDGRDVRENDISLTRLLRPNARINVRLLRDGRVREIPVTVAAVPSRIAQRRGDEVRDAREAWDVPEGPGFPRIMIAPNPGAARGFARVSVSAPNAPTPAVQPARSILLNVGTNGAIAGAQFTTITRDLGEAIGQALGATSGVLVTNAPIGSPASESGLRDGDVIVKVGGQAVRTVSQLRELVRQANNEGNGVDVDILRQKRAQRIVLKW
jgi:S1-C subfamily serine protease